MSFTPPTRFEIERALRTADPTGAMSAELRKREGEYEVEIDRLAAERNDARALLRELAESDQLIDDHWRAGTVATEWCRVCALNGIRLRARKLLGME